MPAEGVFNPVIGQSTSGSQGLVHGAQFREESRSDVLPEDALLAVEHIGAGLGLVDVFEVVAKRKLSLIIDANRRVHVIRK